MEELSSRNNYIFTLIKFVLFLAILCFLVEMTRAFWQELHAKESFSLNILVLSIISSFVFSVFVADQNKLYKKVQNFFFRNSFFSLLFPSVLILLSVGYFFIPKVLGTGFDKDVFVFLGGFTLTTHLSFIAKETKGHAFAEVINYLFNFSILYILNLILFGSYLRIGFKVYIGKVIVEGISGGAVLIQDTFTQVLR
mgnify:CR=1 FL=1